MNAWDVIIVGAGFGGLCTGALLTQAGKKVLVLEKDAEIGGVAKSVKYRGQILDDAAHIPSQAGHLERIFADLGLSYPEKIPIRKGVIYLDGKWTPAKDLFSPEQLKKALGAMLKLSPEAIRALDDIPLNEWADSISDDPGIKLFYLFSGCATSVGNRFATYSAGEMIYILREILDSGLSLGEVGGVVKGGTFAILKPLAEYIANHGGQVRLNTAVESLLIKNGRAQGVCIEKGEKVFSSQLLDLETISAEYVIVTAPLWDIFNLLDRRDFPVWWVDWANWIARKVSYVFSIIYAVNTPLFNEDNFRITFDLPRSGFAGLFYPMPSYGAEAGQYQFHVSCQGHYDEMPDLFNAKEATVKRQVRKLLAAMEEDTFSLFPELKDNYLWRVPHAKVYNIAQSPGLVGSKRPSMIPPGVKHLYLVSCTVQEARGIGMQGVAACARQACRNILGVKN